MYGTDMAHQDHGQESGGERAGGERQADQGQAAICRLLEEHRGYVEALCRRFLDPDEAADAAQEALLRATCRFHTLQERAKIRPWLAVIARHACDDLLRARLRAGPAAISLDELECGGRMAARPSPEAGALEQAGIDGFWAALRETLTPETCFILYCAYALEMTAEEISKQLGMEPGAVRVRKSRALPAVREAAARCLGPAE